MGEKIKLTADRMRIVVELPEGPFAIERHRNDMQLITGHLQPIVPVAGVTPVGEVEVLEVLGNADYVVVDMRGPDWRLKGTIPGSVSIPFGEVAERLDELGCPGAPSRWNCADAKNVVAFCNGPACPQSSTAIRAMVDNGFPPEKILYYRGGMQDWLVLGLTTTAPAA